MVRHADEPTASQLRASARAPAQRLSRRVVLGGLLAGGLAAPARGLTQTLTQTPGESLPGSVLPKIGPMLPATPAPTDALTRRVLALAAQQRDRLANLLWHTDVVAIADFALPSAQPRFHLANLESGTVRSFLVAHGKGSDPEHDGFLKVFSNAMGSLATSRGAFLTTGWYRGKYGTSIRLDGIDPDNTNAFDRAIVVHPAWYANPDMLEKFGKLGRSEGCFALPQADFTEALERLGAGRLIYADRLNLT